MSDDPVWPVNNSRSLSRGYAASAAGGGGRCREPVWDDNALVTALRGNANSAVRLTGVFLDEYPRLLKDLRSAQRAGDWAGLKGLAHRLKGNARILRAAGVAQAAELLEGDVGSLEPERLGERLDGVEQALTKLCEAIRAFRNKLQTAPH